MLCTLIAGGECENGWTQSISNRRCYIFSSSQKTHGGAEDECEKLSATLATISDATENTFLKNL